MVSLVISRLRALPEPQEPPKCDERLRNSLLSVDLSVLVVLQESLCWQSTAFNYLQTLGGAIFIIRILKINEHLRWRLSAFRGAKARDDHAGPCLKRL